jgi:filamentous hemagglutinin
MVLATGGMALSLAPEAAPLLAFGLGAQGVSDGMPLGSGTVRATGFLGSKRLQLQNAPYQTTRNAATTIGNRPFSGHALDQMQNRGVPPTVVDNTILTGAQRAGNTAAEVRYYDPVNNLSVVVDRATGRVVTVRSGD